MAMQNVVTDGMNNGSEGGSSLPPKKRPYQFQSEIQEKTSRHAIDNFRANSKTCEENASTLLENVLTSSHECEDASSLGKSCIECEKLSAFDNNIAKRVTDDTAYHINNPGYLGIFENGLEPGTNNEFEVDSSSTTHYASDASIKQTKAVTNSNSVTSNELNDFVGRVLDSNTAASLTSCTTAPVFVEQENMLTKTRLREKKNVDVTAVDSSISNEQLDRVDMPELSILQKTSSIESSLYVNKFVDSGESDSDCSASLIPFATSPVKQITTPQINIEDDLATNNSHSSANHIPNNIPQVSLKQAKAWTVSTKLRDANETDSDASNTFTPLNASISQNQNPKAGSDSKVNSIIDLTDDDDHRNAGDEHVIDLTDDNDCDVVLESITKHLNFLPYQADFLLKYADDILQSNGITKAVSIQLCDNGISVSGPCQKVDSVAETLQQVSWYVEKLCYDCPKVSHHFQTDIWNDFIKVVKDANRCSIAVDLSASSELPSSNDSNVLHDGPVAIESNAISSHGPGGLLTNWPSGDLLSFVTHPPKLTSYGSVEVMVCKGDITDDYSFAIVNGVGVNFNFNSELSLAIMRKAGPQLSSDCQTMPLMEGCNQRLRVTHAYGLNCTYVMHLVIPPLQEYTAMIFSLLSFAEYHNITSIAIPAIGTGNCHYDPGQVSQFLAQAFTDFSMQQPCCLKKIKVVIFNSAIYDIFVSNIVTAKDIINIGCKHVLSLESQMKAMSQQNKVVIRVNSDRSDDTQKVKERIVSHMKNFICERKIDDEIVMKLGDHDCGDIYEMAVKHHVQIKYNRADDGSFAGLTLLGLNEAVSKMHDYLRQLWYELQAAEFIARSNVWKWTIGNNAFVNLPCRVSHALEQAYEKNSGGQAEVRLFGRSLEVNFATMCYSFHGTVGGLLREDAAKSAIISVPKTWADMGDKALLRVVLDSYSTEFQRVRSLFVLSYPNMKSIERIERVQNKALYEQYLLMKDTVTKRLQSNNLVERELFHGTSEEDAMKICQHGFDRGFAGKNATAFGKGVYFAVASSYSANYARKQRGTNLRYMFMACVLTGDFAQGASNMRTAPVKTTNGSEDFLYDSVVDNCLSPSMFVVFKDSSAYPSYLIVFR